MYDIQITRIGPVVREPPVATLPSRVWIKSQTPEGQRALEMSPDITRELAAAISRHLQDHDSR